MTETTTGIDYFICHASEDKISFVRPLVQNLMKNGASVFYDEYSLKLGDSLLDRINEGLSHSKNAVVILSKFFFEKSWTNAELRGIFQRHIAGEFRLLLIYHGISHEDVIKRYPLLADTFAVDSSKGIEEVASHIFSATGFKPRIGYGKAKLGNDFVRIKDTGFCCSIRFQIHGLSDKYIDKYVFDFGGEDGVTNRISLRLSRNSLLIGSVTDAIGRTAAISCAAEPFLKSQHLLTLQIAASRVALELYVDGAHAAEPFALPRSFINSLSISGSWIVLNSSDLVFPCAATVSFLTMAKELSQEEVAKLFRAVNDFNLVLGR